MNDCSAVTSDGSGSIILDPGQPSMVWVWIWKSSPKNIKFFNFFPFGSKKISSGQVKKYPGQGRVCLLFTAGQKYARVGSGPISSSNLVVVVMGPDQKVLTHVRLVRISHLWVWKISPKFPNF